MDLSRHIVSCTNKQAQKICKRDHHLDVKADSLDSCSRGHRFLMRCSVRCHPAVCMAAAKPTYPTLTRNVTCSAISFFKHGRCKITSFNNGAWLPFSSKLSPTITRAACWNRVTTSVQQQSNSAPHIYIYIYMARTSFSAYLLVQKHILAAEIQGFGPPKSCKNLRFFDGVFFVYEKLCRLIPQRLSRIFKKRERPGKC